MQASNWRVQPEASTSIRTCGLRSLSNLNRVCAIIISPIHAGPITKTFWIFFSSTGNSMSFIDDDSAIEESSVIDNNSTLDESVFITIRTLTAETLMQNDSHTKTH